MTNYQQNKLNEIKAKLHEEAHKFYTEEIEKYLELCLQRVNEAIDHNFNYKLTNDLIKEYRTIKKFYEYITHQVEVKNEELAKEYKDAKKKLGLFHEGL